MKKILNVIVLTLALNFIVALGGAAVVLNKSHMDKDKFKQVKELLFATSQPAVADSAATQPAATTEPVDRLADLLAKASGRPAGEQVNFIRQSFDTEMAELDRKHRELEDLQHQIDLARDQTKVDRAKVEQAQKDLLDRQQLQEKQATDEGFQKSLDLYNAMAPKQVKTIFMTLSEDTVTAYIQAMEPRTANKIFKEFKTPDELTKMQKIMEKIRLAKMTDVSGTPVAPVVESGSQAAVPPQ